VPLGVSQDGLWLKVELETGEQGWVAYAAEYEDCNVAAVDLPVEAP